MKFNFLTRQKNVTKNYEDAVAYKMTPEYELYSAVVPSGLQASFYENEDDRLARIQALIQKCHPEFVAKLAIYTRKQMYMRSIPLVLSVELAKSINGNNTVSKMIDQVVQRADEITELLAYYQLANRRTETKKLNKLSKQVQKGLAKSFNRFDEYQFAKYNAQAAVKLKDALFLVHPKPKDEAQQLIFNKIATDTLSTPYTWETELSALGTQRFANEKAKKAAFAQKWEELIDSGKLGFMALLRNLRNIIEAGVSAEHIQMVCDKLSDRKAVMNAKQLPFRFLSAYRELKGLSSSYTSAILNALEDAVQVSASNIRGFDMGTSVLLACDVSGSMQQSVSPKSKVMFYDIGLILAMLLQSQCKNVITGMFGDRWKIINMPGKSVLQNVEAFYKREGEVGYSTNGHLVIEDLIQRKAYVDKVMLFTDTQMWNSKGGQNTLYSEWVKYKNMAPKAKLYIFDLAGYGKQPIDIRQDDVYLIAGWSDKIFDILAAMDNVGSAIAQIEGIEL